MSNAISSQIRPEFANFASQFGISKEQLEAGARSVETAANAPGETFLLAVVEKMATTYAKTDEMLKDGKPDSEIDVMQKEAATVMDEHPESMEVAGAIFEDAQNQFQAGPLPGGYIAGNNGICGVDMYQMDWKHSTGLFAGKLGTVLVDTTPDKDGLVYYICQTGNPNPDVAFPGF